MEDNAALEAVHLTDYIKDATTVLPAFLEMAEAVTAIERAFSETNGATFSLYFGSMVCTPYFAVSIYQDLEARHSKWWNGRSLTAFKLKAFIASNRELLQEPRSSVGIWYDVGNDRTYLEVTATLPFRHKADYTEAVYQGRRFNQIGIYDLEENIYLGLGGTGDLPEDAPPTPERLPPLQRGGEL